MKKIIVILVFMLHIKTDAQDTLLIEFTSTNPKIPLRNQKMHDFERIKGIDTAKMILVDWYSLSYIFLHSDSFKIRELSYEELKKIKVLTKKRLSVHLDKISEKERIEHKKKLEKMTDRERMTLPEPYEDKARDKQENYLKSSKLFLVIKDEENKKAKIIPVRYIPDLRM